MMKPHVHAALIKAWADGAEIEYWDDDLVCWRSVRNCSWLINGKYRIKPERVYPTTSMTAEEFYKIYVGREQHVDWREALVMIANAAIKRYIQDTEK